MSLPTCRRTPTSKKVVNNIKTATLDTEREYFSSGVQLIAGMDEVGRGSLSGPVSVGVSLVSASDELLIDGLIDSKALTEKKRTEMVPLINKWIPTAVGHTQPEEIDALGMTRSLRLAGQRALAQVVSAEVMPDLVLLDGKHDWLTASEPDLLISLDPAEELYQRLTQEAWGSSSSRVQPWEGPVVTIIKGDYKCASIAAASVVAKVERDALMNQLAQRFPAYGWHKNKGYGSASHRQALDEIGPSTQHRLSWNLGVSAEQVKTTYVERAVKNNER